MKQLEYLELLKTFKKLEEQSGRQPIVFGPGTTAGVTIVLDAERNVMELYGCGLVATLKADEIHKAAMDWIRNYVAGERDAALAEARAFLGQHEPITTTQSEDVRCSVCNDVIECGDPRCKDETLCSDCCDETLAAKNGQCVQCNAVVQNGRNRDGKTYWMCAKCCADAEGA